jgi:hypothetical protein
MMTETTNGAGAPAKTLNDTIRGWNDVLGMWRLCRNPKCVRAQACRGANAYRCYYAHSALLPDSLIAWFRELAEAQREGVSYAEAMERMRDTIAENALEDWHEAIAWSEKVLKAPDLTWPMP